MKHQHTFKAKARWDAGETGCSRLIVGVRRELELLDRGELLEVIAREPSASIDLLVWCRMTGHELISEAHPVYIIQR